VEKKTQANDREEGGKNLLIAKGNGRGKGEKNRKGVLEIRKG